MKICIIGTGYVGLTTAAILADIGHDVTCLDIDPNKINALQNGHVTIFEPGLDEYLKRNHNRLNFTLNRKKAVQEAEVIFLTVGTPSRDDGSSDLSYLHAALDDLAKHIHSYKTIVIKSTVPPGTNVNGYERLLKKGVNPKLFNIVSNPEFLREGSAIYDSRYPERIVIGVQKHDETSIPIMKSVYKGIEAPLVVTSLSGAEMIKYASNAFLATKISFINEMARICDQYDVDVTDVAKGIGLDSRIGPHFLQAGIGYGGSCFPKDLQALEYSAKQKNIEPSLLNAVQQINDSQVDYFLQKCRQHITNERTIAVLGIAFKPNTDDIRDSAAVKIIQRLHEVGFKVKAYDPEARLPKELHMIPSFSSPYDAMKNADAVIIATDWEEHKQLDWNKVKQLMKGKMIFDGRNCLNRKNIRAAGLTYIGMGRP
ncbi:UDP-glucose/GDP-mannose dehydrogenase family protein [Bacillus sp. FJAT-47783]|uniref:UDP-glucose dehydrogenase family protein n=1 Tax=Bacillus sp. FJAT-47783 TaxID=2922712 RepID=UPI001FADD7CF|nr:UDP-glucose/GDP-mannose dehydrogenase family protein [Bacillus sp. FJAT-47783]